MAEELLKQIYYDPNNPASYGGAGALARVSGLPLKRVVHAKKPIIIHTPQASEEILYDKTISGWGDASFVAS